MDKKKGVYVQMNRRELAAYRKMKARDSRSDREILFSGAGLPVEQRRRGRISAADAALKIQRDRYADYRYTIHEDGLRYLNGDTDFTAKRVVCPNCGVSFVTRRPAPGQCTCWRCGQSITLKAEAANWELEPSTLNPSKPETAAPSTREGNAGGWVEPEREGHIDAAETGWDISRFKFGDTKPHSTPQYKKDVDEATKALREQNRKLQLERDEEYRRRLAEG